VSLTADVSGILPVANGGSPFNQANGAIFERLGSQDLLLGSNATDSAKFAFTNVAGGTPTASISANNGNNATYLTGTGNLGTTNAQTLTLGSSSTGNISLYGLGAGIIHSNASGVLSSSPINLAGGVSEITGTLGATNGGTG